MHTTIVIDDELLAKAMRITGLRTKKAVVNEALRLLVRAEEWEDAEDIRIATERLKNPGRWLTMEEAEKELGLGD